MSLPGTILKFIGGNFTRCSRCKFSDYYKDALHPGLNKFVVLGVNPRGG